MREVVFDPTLSGWREAARRLVAQGVPPEEVQWSERPPARDLFESPARDELSPAPELRVPRSFVELAADVAAADDPDRWRLLYAVLWRLTAGDRELLGARPDSDVRRLREIAASRGGSRAGATAAAGAEPFVPPTSSLSVLAEAVQKCRGCDLYRHATQAVFGEGSPEAKLVLVGEVPGDQEDLQGRPFVGPAGAILDRALAEVKLDRREIYVTNTVKHFKFTPTPKRRIHQTPNSAEIEACKPWLFKELEILRPEVLVSLGATASKALFGPSFRLLRQRGTFLDSTLAPKVLATYHPSAVLRADDDAGRDRIYGALVSDLRLAAEAARR